MSSNSNLPNLTETTAPVSTDLAYVAVDPAGTPLDRKVTLGNLLKGSYKITSTATSTAPTPTGDGWRNELVVTALTDNATIAAPTGTPAAGNMLKVVITASGGTRTIGYNAALEAGNITRTTSLPAGSTLTQVYQRANGKWTCLLDDVTT